MSTAVSDTLRNSHLGLVWPSSIMRLGPHWHHSLSIWRRRLYTNECRSIPHDLRHSLLIGHRGGLLASPVLFRRHTDLGWPETNKPLGLVPFLFLPGLDRAGVESRLTPRQDSCIWSRARKSSRLQVQSMCDLTKLTTGIADPGHGEVECVAYPSVE